MYYHDRSYVTLGRTDGNCTEIRLDRGHDKRDFAVYNLSFSQYTTQSSGEGIYFHESYRQYLRSWLGVYAGRA